MVDRVDFKCFTEVQFFFFFFLILNRGTLKQITRSYFQRFQTDYGCGTKIAFDLIVFQLRAWRSVPLREPRATQLCQFLFRNPEASLRQLLYIIRIKWKHAWKMDNCVIYTISISVVCSFAFETSRDLDPRNSSTPQWEEEVFIG